MFERLHHDQLDKPLRRNGTFAKSKFLRWYERQEHIEAHPIRHTLKRLLGKATLVAAGASLIASQIDIAENKRVQAESDIDIHVAAQALDPQYNDHSIVMLSGYGYLNADHLTGTLGPAIQSTIDGQLWSVDYDNASLDAAAIASKIIETASDEGVNTINLVGHSIGGITAIQVAEVLAEESSLRVQTIFTISTPDGYDGLRPWKQDQINLTGLLDVFPDLVYSTPFQLATETIFRHDQYDDGNLTDRTVNFVLTASDVWEKVVTQKLPGNWLINDQVLALQNAKLEQRLEAIGNTTNRLNPVIIYIGTGRYDSSVNDEVSAEGIGQDAIAAELDYIALKIPGLTHETPWRSAEELAQVLQTANPQIQQLLDKNNAAYRLETLRIITPVR